MSKPRPGAPRSAEPRDVLPATAGVAAALLYLAWPSFYYNFDGVACAIAVDLGDLAHLAHGNHVLYGLAGLAFQSLWRALGYRGPSLLALQALSALLGGVGVAVFCSLLLRLRVPRLLAAACAAGLALSQAYWFWSLEAQVYPLGLVFAALAWRAACAEKPDPFAVGAWQGLAVLGHVGHAMLAAPLLYLLAREGRARRAWPRYVAAAAVVTAAGYAFAALVCVKPHSSEELRAWLLGSAALTLDKSVRWYGGYSWTDLREWLRMTPRLFADFSGLSGAAFAGALVLDALALGACAAGARAAKGSRRAVALSALLWLVSYALLFVSWQPYTVVYRISDLLPLWLLLAFGLEALGRAALPAAVAGAAALGAFNGKTAIAPHADPKSNAALQEAAFVAESTPQDAWIVVTGLGQVYVPYFAHRRPLNTKYFEGKPEELARRLDALASAKEPVFVTQATLDKGAEYGWDASLRAYGLAPAAEGLYRVAR